jgi:hypothetical protein
MTLVGKAGGILAVLMSPLLWLVLAGPFALALLIALLRSLRR